MHKGLTYWGYVIAGDGIDLMETMVDAIKNAPKPKNESVTYIPEYAQLLPLFLT